LVFEESSNSHISIQEHVVENFEIAGRMSRKTVDFDSHFIIALISYDLRLAPEVFWAVLSLAIVDLFLTVEESVV
jgi:hypothetical protein